MEPHQHNSDAVRQAMCQYRATKVRGWARWVFWTLVFTGMIAIWQDRALAPPLHDGLRNMGRVSANAIAWLEGARGSVTQVLSQPAASGSQRQFGAITQWFLDNR